MNIMINLKNISKIGNILSATVITVEAHPKTFEIAVDIVEKKLVKNTYGKIDMNIGMAMSKLIKLSEECCGSMPKESQSV